MNPTVQNITVVGKEKGCHEGSRSLVGAHVKFTSSLFQQVSYELTNSMHLTPECLQRASFPAAATATTPVLAFKYSRTLVGMGHSVEGQLNVAKEIATQNGWQWLELWTDGTSMGLESKHILDKSFCFVSFCSKMPLPNFRILTCL